MIRQRHVSTTPQESVCRTDGDRSPTCDLGQGSTCEIHEHEDGFTINPVARPPVKVGRVEGVCFEMEAAPGHRQRFGLTETQALLDTIVRLVRRPRKGIRNAARVRRVLAEPVRLQYERLLRAVHPDVLAVYRAISAVTTARPKLAMCPHLYRHTHLVHDIINYRAAAIVATSFHALVPCLQTNSVTTSPQAADLESFAASQGEREFRSMCNLRDSGQPPRDARRASTRRCSIF